ncbi:chromosomal replication initiator protein DnaA [Bdellovibrio sp. qaytius]|nr:chromosomal replication initiator protein DnaA [Bdellovibrio sp. qaytius]
MKQKNGSNRILESYLEPVEFISTEKKDDKFYFTLSVPNQFIYFYVNENLKEKIVAEIKGLITEDFEINLIVSAKNSIDYNSSLQDMLQNSDELLQIQNKLNQPKAAALPIVNMDLLGEEFTFSTFVVGKNSEFAHAATYNVSQSPGEGDYNPLFIYGPSGMGKTHLLKAAIHQIHQNYPHYRVLYTSAEKFLNECVQSIRRQEMDKFRMKYRENCDVLVVDDVQYIERGERVQEEFFHTVNAFIERRRQVILASDRMPKDILNLEDRSRTRLERGLIADITMPDFETRIAILRYKVEKKNLRIPEDAIQYLARISKRSIRELEGNLNKIKMFSELQGVTVNLELARKILSHHENTATISVDEILRITAEYFKIRITDLKSSSRAKPVVVPRQIAMWLIKKFLDKSLVEIGKTFGGRDHTTVINSLEKVESQQAKDLQYKSDIDELVNQIHNITGL